MPGTAAKGGAAGGMAGLASGMSALIQPKPTIPKIIHQVAKRPSRQNRSTAVDSCQAK